MKTSKPDLRSGWAGGARKTKCQVLREELGSSLFLGLGLKVGTGAGAGLRVSWDLACSGQHHREGNAELSCEPGVPRVTDLGQEMLQGSSITSQFSDGAWGDW